MRRREKTRAGRQVRHVSRPFDSEIVQLFNNLEIQACAWGDHRKGDLHLERMLNCAEVVKDMPSKFMSIKQAGFMLSKNMLRGIHLRFTASVETQAAPSSCRLLASTPA